MSDVDASIDAAAKGDAERANRTIEDHRADYARAVRERYDGVTAEGLAADIGRLEAIGQAVGVAALIIAGANSKIEWRYKPSMSAYGVAVFLTESVHLPFDVFTDQVSAAMGIVEDAALLMVKAAGDRSGQG
jgi:hypothetical protein